MPGEKPDDLHRPRREDYADDSSYAFAIQGYNSLRREYRCTCTRSVPSDPELTTERDPNCPWHRRRDGE